MTIEIDTRGHGGVYYRRIGEQDLKPFSHITGGQLEAGIYTIYFKPWQGTIYGPVHTVISYESQEGGRVDGSSVPAGTKYIDQYSPLGIKFIAR